MLLQAFEDAKQDEYERVHQPSTYQAVTQHYHTKAVSCLKSALDCYKKVSVLNMAAEQHGEYIAGLEKIIFHESANEKRYYAAELANLLVSLGQIPLYATQKTIYLEKAKNLYESFVLTANHANEEFNQNIFYLKNAVQLYQQLTAEQVGETRKRSLESAIGLYYQIADYYCTKQKSERQLAEVYQQQAQLLEQALHPQENHYHAPLSSSFPMHQRRNVTSSKKPSVTEDAVQVSLPLLNKIP